MEKTKLDWDKFKGMFGTWADKIQPFFENGGLDPVYEQLKKDSQRGKKIAPLSGNVYRCFTETPLADLKAVVCGFCPYHTFKNGSPVADGLALGCSVTNKLQPSLEIMYDEIERSVYNGLSLDGDKNPDVSFLAHQGILMFNASLTTEMNKAGSHLELWEPFTKYIFEEIIAVERVPVIFLGKEASKFKRYLSPFQHSFEISHPAFAARMQTDWDSKGAFLKVKKLVKEFNDYDIEWLDVLPF